MHLRPSLPESDRSVFQRIENMHPHLTLLYLSVGGMCILFSFLLLAFTVARMDAPGFRLGQFPLSFVWSTLILLASSVLIVQARRTHEEGQLEQTRQWLWLTVVAGLIFSVFQYQGWQELAQAGIHLQARHQADTTMSEALGQVSGAYLYVISGVHLAHLVGGMIFVVIVAMQFQQASQDQVLSIIYRTEPYQRLKLRMLAFYWHFMDALWVMLFLYFLISF